MRGRHFIAILLLAAACNQSPPVIIGAKGYSEQQILAEIVAGSLGPALSTTIKIEPCGESFQCQQALRRGSIDLMVEYTGTGYLYSGSPALDAKPTVDELRSLYEPLGLRWFDPLGFDNGFQIVMKAGPAKALELETIADLSHLKRPRFAVPDTYLRRPREGYAALIERHGIKPGGVTTSSKPAVNAGAVLDGTADAAVVYATDGAVAGLDLVALSDSLDFFPPYEAAILAREDFLGKHPQAEPALAKLSGGLDEAKMRELNYRVDVAGWSPESAAREYLQERGIAVRKEKDPRAELILAMAASDHLESELARAARAIRAAYPNRALVVEKVDDPVALVAQGKAKLALIGAERFFPAKSPGEQDHRLEAITVMSSRVLHILRRADDPGPSLAGKVGLEPASTGSGQAGAAIAGAAKLTPAMTAERSTLFAALRDRRLDAVLMLAQSGDSEIIEEVIQGGLSIAPLDDPTVRGLLPHLRPARIPALTYGQNQPIGTLSSQVVLAAPNRARSPGQVAGPTGVVDRGPPLPLSEAEALAQANPDGAVPDTSLPSPWAASVNPEQSATPPLWQPVFDTILNLVTLIFLGWAVSLATVRARRQS